MKNKTILVVGLAVVIGCVVVSVAVVRRQAPREATWQTAKAEREARARNQARRVAEPAPEPSSPEEIITSSDSNQQTGSVKGDAKVKVKPQKAPAQAGQSPGSKEVADPLARLALSFVGADPEAEEYWIEAINDPSLSAHERQDLIEDLNEDGLSDPRHPGLEDLPLIVNRIRLIEELAPYAMDRVNADAFQEADKDLVNLLNGQPPQ